MTEPLELRTASAADLADIRALLKSVELPFEDIAEQALPGFIVLRDPGGALLATGGVEACGNDGLLRSVAVSKDARGKSLAASIVAAVEAGARKRNFAALYLLTNTAPEYFLRLGYEPFERTAVPEAISRSTEFASICPANATCMKKNLE